MSLNCNEINLILSELNLKETFIQEIIQSGYDTLGFKIVGAGERFNLLICTSAKACRINATTTSFPKNKKPLRFNEFLKARVQGMRINECKQIGLDRIIKMDVSTWKEKLYIYIRLWSGASNIIVTDTEGNILDCMFRRPSKGEVSGGHFIPEEKTLTEEEINEAKNKFPVRTFNEELKTIAEEKNLNLTELSFNKKVDLFYSESAGTLSREALLAQAEKWYNVKKSKMENALEKLEAKKKMFDNAESLKHTADLVLAFQSEIKDGALDCTDYETGNKVHIKLDPKLSAHENANIYYEQYKKCLSGKENLNHDIELAKKQIIQLDEEYKKIQTEKNIIKIEQLIRQDTTPKQKTEKERTGLLYEVKGWTIIVGRTANENDELLRHNVKGMDLWLHTRDYAGGYVFIKAKKDKTVPLEILLYAGNLAVYHSKARKNGQADLYYTQVKHLRRAKNGPKGLVLPTNEKNLHIKLDTKILQALDECEK